MSINENRILNFILFIRLLFCYYFNFNGHRLLLILAKFYCILLATFISIVRLYICIKINSPYLSTWVLINTDFLINVLVSCYYGENHVITFCNEIKFIDFLLSTDKKSKKTSSTFCIFFVIWFLIVRIIFIISYCFFSDMCHTPPYRFITMGFLLIAIDVSHIPRLIILFLTLSRMYILSNKIEQYSSGVVEMPVKQWDYYLNVYWKLLDSFRATEQVIKNLILTNLLCTFPKLLCWIYSGVITNVALDQNGFGFMVIVCLENIYAALLASLPGVIAAMTESRVEHIKFILTSELYSCKDTTEAASIKKFLRFIKLRPFALRIWRLIPVDMTLPVGLLSLCATYVIVLAQFPH